MEPRDSAEPVDLNALRIDVLRSAVEIYVRLAYEGERPPETVRRRIHWPIDATSTELLSAPPFERAGRNKSNGSLIYALRLGNSKYPHMKLQIQPWPNPSGFMLSVNTHDQVLAVDPEVCDQPAFRELQSANQRYKDTIEQAWDNAGLPTFLRYLRDYIAERSCERSAESASTTLAEDREPRSTPGASEA